MIPSNVFKNLNYTGKTWEEEGEKFCQYNYKKNGIGLEATVICSKIDGYWVAQEQHIEIFTDGSIKQSLTSGEAYIKLPHINTEEKLLELHNILFPH